MGIFPPGGAAPPPPVPEMGGLAAVLGQGLQGAQGGGVGDQVAGQLVAKLRPIWRMVGEMVDYLIENPEIAPAAKSIISMSFGSAKKLGSRRDRAEDALGQAVGQVGVPGPLPPLPQGAGPLPGMVAPPILANRGSPF